MNHTTDGTIHAIAEALRFNTGGCALSLGLKSHSIAAALHLDCKALGLQAAGHSVTSPADHGHCKTCLPSCAPLAPHVTIRPMLSMPSMHSMCPCTHGPHAGTLKEVAVAGARASEEAAMALIRAAMRNNSLSLLDFRGIPLGNEVCWETPTSLIEERRHCMDSVYCLRQLTVIPSMLLILTPHALCAVCPPPCRA